MIFYMEDEFKSIVKSIRKNKLKEITLLWPQEWEPWAPTKFIEKIKEYDNKIFTKSGLMLGLGESEDELYQVMDDLRCANVDFLTLGQYLQPTEKHFPIKKFVEPNDFDRFKKVAYSKGFLLVSSSPMTRSSYHAGDDFKKLKEKRLQNLI